MTLSPPKSDAPGLHAVNLFFTSLGTASPVVEPPPNYITLYELDQPDPDGHITRLNFPSTSGTLANCDQEGCAGDRNQWGEIAGSSHPGTGVSAEMRMAGTAEDRSNCRH